MQELLLATGNQGKFKEIEEILGEIPFKLLSLKDLGLFGDFEEDGETFADNAYLKARYFADKSGLPTVAEDSGVFVNALEGELGLKTRRWGAGENASDEEWLEYFIERMNGAEDRRAKFVCSVCYLDDSKEMKEFFDGETAGEITRGIMAPLLPGLPLSSCFLPEGVEKVYAALGAEEKNSISHRGGAVSKLREYLLAQT